MIEALSNLHFIWTAFAAQRMKIALVVLLSLLYSILEASAIVVLLPVIEEIIGKAHTRSMVWAAVNHLFQAFGYPFRLELGLLAILVFFILKSCFQFLSTYLTAKYTETHRVETMSRLFQNYVSADWDYLVSHRMGTLLDVVLNETSKVQLFFKGCLTQLTNMIYTLALIGFAFCVSSGLTGLSLLFVVIMGILIFRVIPTLKRLGDKVLSLDQNLWNQVMQYLFGFKTLKAYDVLASACVDVEKQARQRGQARTHMAIIDSGLSVLIELLFLALLLSFIYLPVLFGWSIAEAGVIAAFMFRIAQRARGMRGIASLGEFLPALRLVDYMQREFKVSQYASSESDILPRFEQSIRFSRVSFSYRSSSRGGVQVLRDISFELKNGEVVGIVGPSGAGKSTLAALLLGLLSPSEGTIEVDGLPLQVLCVPAWRQLVGYVPQEGFLLHASIYENIEFLRQGLGQEQVEQAAKQANIHDFIRSLPAGYHTLVGDNGVTLSGGERQRICLARALAGDPCMLILDEATSALDSQAEKVILQAIGRLRQQRKITIVIIAHRFGAIEHADRIIVLDGGELVEVGTRRELLHTPGSVFGRMYALQNPKP